MKYQGNVLGEVNVTKHKIRYVLMKTAEMSTTKLFT